MASLHYNRRVTKTHIEKGKRWQVLCNEQNQEMLVSTQMMLLSGITLRLLDGGVACRPFLNRWGQEQVSLDVLQKLQSHLLGWGGADRSLSIPDYSCSTCVANRCCINDGQSGVRDDTHTGGCMESLKSCGRRVIQLFYTIQEK